MAGLIPFNKSQLNLRSNGFGDFYNMLDDFFSDTWLSRRNLNADTFKLDVRENDNEYLIEAELPGVKKDEINLEFNDDKLSISVNKEETIDEKDKNYIHKERRCSSMQRSIYLEGTKPEEVKAKLEEGVLRIVVPKVDKPNNTVKINIA